MLPGSLEEPLLAVSCLILLI